VADFQDIEIDGIDQAASRPAEGVFWQIHVRLSAAPPEDWQWAFDANWTGGYTGFRNARVSGNRIIVHSPPDEMETHIAELKKAIAAANRLYRDRVVPAIEQKAEIQRKAEEEEAATRSRLNGLDRKLREQRPLGSK
jgi:hypothetical protein